MFSSVFSAQTTGIDAKIVTVEVDVSKGLHRFSLVGLAGKAVEESRDRVNAAIKNSGLTAPKQKNHKTTVALAPADLKKVGPVFDVAIAVGYLKATKQIRFSSESKLFLGELSLDGGLRRIKGVLPLVKKAREEGFTEVFLPRENTKEAALIDGIVVYGAGNLSEILEHINEKKTDQEGNERIPTSITPSPKTKVLQAGKNRRNTTDFSDIRGQDNAKRALEIAAAGRHNVALYGPPGTGKTMLARAFTGILPDLTPREALEITGIHSVAGTLEGDLMTEVPFRAPHHTASFVSLVGGGNVLKPGEITLAHRGVLFLDEFPEFERRASEALRQPLEDRKVSITRASGHATYPANFIFIAAMNPCPCGNFGTDGKACICSPAALSNYQRKMSGPIMDRIDIWVEVGKVDPQYFKAKPSEKRDESGHVRKKVQQARGAQTKRFKHLKREYANSEMTSRQAETIAGLSEEARAILGKSARTMDISARAYYRIIKTARTIADLEENDTIESRHILEALQYRPRKIFE